MIRAVLYQAGGQLTGFSVRGHAGYAPEGSDIVCAAVSVLTTTCVNALESVAGVVPEVHGGEDGFLEAALPGKCPAEAAHDAQVLMQALRQGLSDLTQAYPRYIRLSIQERRETP